MGKLSGKMVGRIRLVAVFITALAFAPALSASAQSPGSPCADAPHRAFDFWVGEWTVTTKNGPKVGDSSIRRILNDCVILESWTGKGGGTGQSFNNYDARRKSWKQFWVDATGGRQEYEEGVYQDGALRFSGHNPGPKGEPAEQRFTFFNVDPNHVRQLQEQSTDGGKTWTVVYDFYYARKTV
jgi:hypothetical protein